MRGIEAKPNSVVLQWARENAGASTSDAAKRLKIDEARLASWERGDARPTINQLRQLAAYYKRPLAFFYLPEPPRGFQAMHDFRLLPGAELPDSRALRFQVRRAWERRDIAMELFRELDEQIPTIEISASLEDDVDALADRIRDWLGVTFDRQAEWGQTAYTALKEWRGALEARGVLVLQATDVDLREMRGFSIAERPLPVAVANIKDAPRGRVFTFLHELVHILLRENSLCAGEGTGANHQIENFCNRVAAAALVPTRALLASPVVKGHDRKQGWTRQELSRLVRQFGGASEEALLLRMVTAGLATQEFYDARRAELQREYAAQRERDADSDSFVPPHRISLAALGPTFIKLVLEGFERERISASDVADFLGMRLKHLDDVRSEMRRVS